MTTSGTYTYNPNRDQIIRRAARLVSAIAAGETPSSDITSDFGEALNSLCKRYQGQGLHLWAEQECVVLLQPNQVQYGLGPSSADNCTTWPLNAVTTVPLGASLGAGSITVASSTGITSGNVIGVVLSTGTVQWTTVSGAPAGNVVTLAATLTQAVTAGGFVFAYTTRMQRPLRVLSSRRLYWPNNPTLVETPMNPPLSRQDYFNLPSKTTTGTPTQLFHDPQLVTSQVYVWPAPPDWTNAIRMTVMRPLQDINLSTQTVDFPQEWIDTLVFNLALVMCPEFTVPPDVYAMVKENAMMFLEEAKGFDREPESLYVGVSMGHR